jgi:hypothetical protein
METEEINWEDARPTNKLQWAIHDVSKNHSIIEIAVLSKKVVIWDRLMKIDVGFFYGNQMFGLYHKTETMELDSVVVREFMQPIRIEVKHPTIDLNGEEIYSILSGIEYQKVTLFPIVWETLWENEEYQVIKITQSQIKKL